MKLSIIVPFHRGIHFLEDCLESIRDQELTDYETILVLDHVKEEISRVIDAYQDINLKVIESGEPCFVNRKFGKQKTEEQFIGYSGAACARNAGLNAAKGEWIYFLDSDDYIMEDALKLLLQEGEEQKADFVYGRTRSTWFKRKVYLSSIEAKLDEEAADDLEIEGQLPQEQKIESQEEQEIIGIPGMLSRRERKILAISEKLSAAALMDGKEAEQIAGAYHTLFVSKKGLGNISVLGILFYRSFIEKQALRFNKNYIFFSDSVFITRALQRVKICSYLPEAVYIKRKHNDPIHYPALSQSVTEDKFEEYLQAYQETRKECEENIPLRNYLDDKLITYYQRTFAPRLRRSEKEAWRTCRFQAIRAAMQEVDPEKINSLRGYKKRLVKALLKDDVKKATHIVTRHLGFRKFKKIKKNKRIFAYYLYHKLFTKLPVKENWVICETFFGKSYSDSPKYIYEYLNKNYPGKYRFIWSINRHSTKISYHPVKVKRFSIRYCYYMARCKYFVFNVRQPEWYRKREGMVFLETWHGTPLKKLVFDQEEVMAASPLYKAQFYHQQIKWDYLVAANHFSSNAFRSAFRFEKEMLEFGYPRNDILHSQEKDKIAEKIKQKLKLPKGKKLILYAPTWRDDEYYGRGAYKFALKLDLSMLKRELGREYVVLLRTHYFIADSLDITGLEDFAWNVSRYDDISELYLISDLLITDYSSVFFDYANLKRPILFYTYDLDKYRDMLRGFYMDIENDVPGPLLFTNEEVVEAVRNIDEIAEQYEEKYEAFYEKFCSLEDGHASENIAKKVFGLH